MELTQTEHQVEISLIHKCMDVVGKIADENTGETQAFDMLYDMDLPALGATLATLEQQAILQKDKPELARKEKRIVELKKQLVEVIAKIKHLKEDNEDPPLMAIYEKHRDTLITEWRTLTGRFNFP